MKAIKLFIVLGLILICFTHCEKAERDLYSNSDGRFVRFQLLLDNDGKPVNPDRLSPQQPAASAYFHKNIRDVYVPVVLTSEPLDDTVKVQYSLEVKGDYTGLATDADMEVEFYGKKLSDSIWFRFQSRWDSDPVNSILLKLESCSDPEIQLGFPREKDKNDSLEIILSDISLSCKLDGSNLIELISNEGEEFIISVAFPDGFFREEVENFDFFTEEFTDFDYALERLGFSIEGDKVLYTFKLLEDINIDEFRYALALKLNIPENYFLTGSNSVDIIKPQRVERDNSLHTSRFFYDIPADPFNRMYGESWMDLNMNDTCTWNSFFAYTFPVVVDKAHPNAVLFDEGDPGNPDDDVYHHAFRVGFNATNPGRTTNPFNLKRWFNNEASDADVSPGFNIEQALEFYPDDGNSTTGGLVKVIEQDLLISNSDDKQFIFSMEGDGTYSQISEGVYRIDLELRLTNDDLFGGTRIAKYVLFNTDDYIDPVDLTEGCFQPMDLN